LQDFRHDTGSINKKASREKEVRKPGRQTGNTAVVQHDAFTNSEVLTNILKGFSEYRIASNKFKDNVSGRKNQGFFEIYYKFSNDFLTMKKYRGISPRDFLCKDYKEYAGG
jgi:hypothetical protein